MNILEAEDMVKGLPDQVLFQYAQNPPPQIPQFLAISEVQRRQDMRQRFQASQGGNEPTVKDQILQGGIASAGGPPPGTQQPPPMAPMGAAPPGAPMQQPMTGAPMPPMGMAQGGQVPYRMQQGGTAPSFLERSGLPFVSTPEGSAANREALSRFLTPRRAQFSVIRQAQALAQAGRTEEAAALLRSEGIDPARALASVQRPPMEAAAAAPAAAPPTTSPPANLPANFDFMAASQAMTGQRNAPFAVAPPAAAPAATNAPPVSPGGIADVGAAMTNQAVAPPAANSQAALSLQSLLRDLSSNERPEEVQAAIDLQRQQMEQGLPPPVDISQFIQSAQQRQKEAKDESRRMAIAGTLMNLGAGVMSGDPAAGLRQATQTAMSTLGEGRREASAEGRMAEQLQLQAAQQNRQSILDTMKFKSDAVNNIANIVSGERKSDRNDKLQAAQLLITYQNNRDKIVSDERIQLGRNANAAQAARSAALKAAQEILTASPTALFKDGKQMTTDEIAEISLRLAKTLDPEAFGSASSSGGSSNQEVTFAEIRSRNQR
jgi:hypothetical protein